jgi:hypothetical protein
MVKCIRHVCSPPVAHVFYFVDTINVTTSGQVFNFQAKDIAWSSDKQLYGRTKYQADQIVPPPSWRTQYPNWTEDLLNDFDIENNERFMVWMRTAGLPNFKKLYGKSTVSMKPDTYTIIVTGG